MVFVVIVVMYSFLSSHKVVALEAVKAKFHYAIWFEADSVMEFGREPASS